MTARRPRGRCAAAGALLSGALLSAAGCGSDACTELVRRTCGDQEQCADVQACHSARDAQGAGVISACAAGLENPVSYPPCDL